MWKRIITKANVKAEIDDLGKVIAKLSANNGQNSFKEILALSSSAQSQAEAGQFLKSNETLQNLLEKLIDYQRP